MASLDSLLGGLVSPPSRPTGPVEQIHTVNFYFFAELIAWMGWHRRLVGEKGKWSSEPWGQAIHVAPWGRFVQGVSFPELRESDRVRERCARVSTATSSTGQAATL